MNIVEIENVLPQKYLDTILGMVRTDLIWEYWDSTSYSDRQDIGLWDKQMVSVFVNSDINYRYPDYSKYSYFFPLTYILEEKFGLDVVGVMRLKINRTFTCPTNQEPKAWHADHPNHNCKTVLIYLNDSDGGTVVSDVQVADPQIVITDEEMRGVNSVRTEFKQNKAVLFDSNLAHYGELPKHHKCREVMNIVLECR